MLRADQRVVGFVDRPELGRLRAWCADRDGPVAALVTGAGGVGKTRLALRLAEEKQAAGWLCRVVRAGADAAEVVACRRVTRGPVLLVIDYTETRPDMEALLRAAASDDSAGLRVLLVARGAGEWWAQLEASADSAVRHLAGTAVRVPVEPVAGEVASHADLVRAAAREFGRVLKVKVPAGLQVDVPAGATPILVLHAAALLAVLRERDDPDGGRRVVADRDYLLELGETTGEGRWPDAACVSMACEMGRPRSEPPGGWAGTTESGGAELVSLASADSRAICVSSPGPERVPGTPPWGPRWGDRPT